MPLGKIVEVCRDNNWLQTWPYVRANGRHCADICVTDPVTGSRTSKTVSSLSEEKYRNKRDAAEENLCEEIWDSALKILLGGGELTLIDYLQYDAEYLRSFAFRLPYRSKPCLPSNALSSDTTFTPSEA